jgi:signal transduction histidine kinase
VHPDRLAASLYGPLVLPRIQIGVLLALALVLSGGTIALARRFVRHVQEREAFASAVAHDLRTPLTQILLFGESLQLDRPAVQTREEAARVIVRETRRLIHMVENALQFVPGGRARPTLQIEPLELGPFVRETAAAMAPVLSRAGMEVLVQGSGSATVAADRNAVAQILTNLLENAVRFGPAGQTITVTLFEHDGYAVLQVDDQGPGIAAAEREAVFKPFVRAGKSAGIGIGLAVSRQLAELLNGSLVATIAPGGGARLELRLPSAS